MSQTTLYRVVQRAARRGTQRSASTSAAKTKRRGALASDQSSAVKDEDLRGLVALFHESQGWVSSQHLEPYVDQVFVGHLLASKDELGTQQVSGALQQNVQLRFNPAFTNASQLWSDNAPPDWRDLDAALWGRDLSESPGLDTVRDRLKGKTLTRLVGRQSTQQQPSKPDPAGDPQQ